MVKCILLFVLPCFGLGFSSPKYLAFMKNESTSNKSSIILNDQQIIANAPLSISNDDNHDQLTNNNSPSSFSEAESFTKIVQSRYACTRFQRHDNTISNSTNASKSNPKIVQSASQCLDLARRAPSGFNAQPYRLMVIHTPSKKELLAKFCLGRNADRVRDSDCTILFLADKESSRDWRRFQNFLKNTVSGRGRKNVIPNKWILRKIQALVLLFSSGWPLPRVIASPLSFMVRFCVSCVSVFSGRRILVPSLGTAETWASKNVMLVAMTYMLACTSRGIATCPMEGFNVGGIRSAFKIPRRYAIPLIVSTGTPFVREEEEEGVDDAGMAHGAPGANSKGATERYPFDEVIFGDDGFGLQLQLQ